MSTSARYNDQNPTDPIALLAVVLASFLLAKTLTTEEASTFQLMFTILLGTLPYPRR